MSFFKLSFQFRKLARQIGILVNPNCVAVAALAGNGEGKGEDSPKSGFAAKQKDKKSRLLRNLRKEAPARLAQDGSIEFDTDSIAIQCLTSNSADYQNAGLLDFNLAQIVICQSKIRCFIQKSKFGQKS